MLDEIINRPDLDRYLLAFDTGQTIFLEGDDSQDLYILISGQLDILKGDQKISSMNQRGSLFGEMSFLLGARRTATVKAKSDVKVIRIPKEEITSFLQEFPAVAREISKYLAERLDETSQILYGLKEFCDQLPDAVLLTDREGKILTWNTAAEKLYGRRGDQMRSAPVEEIYQEPQAYRNFLAEVQSKYSVREEVLQVRHPEKGTRFISTSTTVLYDGHHNFQGVLSLGRDVTAVKNLERRYRKVRYWLVPFFILLGFLAASIFYGYPYFSRGYQVTDIREQELRNQLARDYLLLKSLLVDPFAAGERPRTTQVMKDFLRIYEAAATPYIGLVLIDQDKKVFDAYAANKDVDISKILGSSYAGIDFRGSERSIHRVLTLYRPDSTHPMGRKGIEVAFEMRKDDRFLGWVVFQMDVGLLARKYGMGEEILEKFQFQEP